MLPSKRWKCKVRMGDTAARHRSLQTGLMLNQELCYEAEGLPDPSRQGSPGISSPFYKVISKVYFITARQQWQPVIIKGRGNKASKEKNQVPPRCGGGGGDDETTPRAVAPLSSGVSL